jgi:hypothetical protein
MLDILLPFRGGLSLLPDTQSQLGPASALRIVSMARESPDVSGQDEYGGGLYHQGSAEDYDCNHAIRRLRPGRVFSSRPASSGAASALQGSCWACARRAAMTLCHECRARYGPSSQSNGNEMAAVAFARIVRSGPGKLL